jgi:putative endonuclease
MSLRSDPADWKDERQRLGAEGEAIAKAHLECEGWRILDHRFRVGHTDLDLIARRENIVAFIEVKTRLTTQFGSPFEAVTWRKRREIGRVAHVWLDRHGKPDDIYRFDVVGVTWMRGQWHVEHLPDAFRLVRP